MRVDRAWNRPRRYRVRGGRINVVGAFPSEDTLAVVTAWRTGQANGDEVPPVRTRDDDAPRERPPRRMPEEDLRAIEGVARPHPDGLTVQQIDDALSPAIA
jgi:hypothetical protein